MAIKRGTTPTHTIVTDVDLRDAEEIYVTYEQNSYNLIEKKKEDLQEILEDRLVVKLTQEETLRFKEKGKIEIQIRALFGDGSALKSNVMETNADRLLKKGVI